MTSVRTFLIAALVAAPLHGVLPAWSITLDEAVETALAQNPRLAASRARARAAEQGPAAAGAFPNPELEGEAVPLTFGDEYEAELGLNQKLPIWGRTGAARALARAELERLRWEALEVERAVAAGTRERYRRVGLIGERLVLAREQERRESWLAGVARSRFHHGEVSELDLRQFEARAALRRAAVRGLEAGLHAARFDLATYIGVSDTTGLVVDRVPLAALSMPADIDSLVAGRPDLRELEADVRIAEAEVALARSERFEDPEVGLLMKWSREGEEADARNKSFLGARFSLPLPFPNGQGARIGFARARVEAARAARDAAREVARQEIRVGVLEAEAARTGALGLTSTAIDSVRAALRLADEAYRSGRIEASELIEVSRAASELESEAIEALDRWFEALGVLEERLGRTLAPSVPRQEK
jgi:cobalt-zinc-cadmium efflux system outer membrane protein